MTTSNNDNQKNTDESLKAKILKVIAIILEAKIVKVIPIILKGIGIILAILFPLILLKLYRSNFNFDKFSTDPSDWGAFGDYIGGLLNPLVAFLALMWLVKSVSIQKRELKQTNDTLEATLTTQKEQQDQVSIQNFESLFFQLLKAKKEALNDIIFEKKTYVNISKTDSGKQETTVTEERIETIKSVDAIREHIIKFKSKPESIWNDYYEKYMLDYAGSYFRICYQLVKLINNNEALKSSLKDKKDNPDLYSSEQKKYFDIFRATLTKHETEAFFFNCLSNYGNKKFKKLVEKYGLFEPLPIDLDRKGESIHRLTRYAYQYNYIIFEENKDWKIYFKDLEKITLNINPQELVENFNLLLELKILKHSVLFQYNKKNDINSKLSGTNYNFEIANKFSNPLDIFSENNFHNIIKYNSIFIENLSQIKSLESSIRQYYETIIAMENHLIKTDGAADLDKSVTLSNPRVINTSINQMHILINDFKKEMIECKTANENLNIPLNTAKNSECSLTALILVKYGINYEEYCNYMQSQKENQEESAPT